MCVCVCVCVCVCMYECVSIYETIYCARNCFYLYIRAMSNKYIYRYMYTYSPIYTPEYADIYVCVCVRVCIYFCICARVESQLVLQNTPCVSLHRGKTPPTHTHTLSSVLNCPRLFRVISRTVVGGIL